MATVMEESQQHASALQVPPDERFHYFSLVAAAGKMNNPWVNKHP
jgi:hypothetical protein